MVAEPTGLAARWAGRVVFDGPAVDVGEVFCDGGAGDSDAEFDGSADGVGDKVSSLVHGSCDVFGFGLGTFLLVSQGPLHLLPHLITGGSTHALQIRNSPDSLVWSRCMEDLCVRYRPSDKGKSGGVRMVVRQ